MYKPIISNIRRSPLDGQTTYTPNQVSLEKVDLRMYTGKVEFQDVLGSCTANAIVSACEVLLQREQKFVDLSRLFLYYNARLLENGVGLEGAYLRYALQASKAFGICPESIWPYDINKVNIKPSDEAYEQALLYRITRYEFIDNTNDETKLKGAISALAEGFPVVISMITTEELENLTGPLDEQQYKGLGHTPFTGLHAVTIVGYDNDKQYFIVENSWGEGWGDQGYFALPYSLLGEVTELWVVAEITSP